MACLPYSPTLNICSPEEIWHIILNHTLRPQTIFIYDTTKTVPYKVYKSNDGLRSVAIEPNSPSQVPPPNFTFHYEGATLKAGCFTPHSVTCTRVAKLLCKESNKAAFRHWRIFPRLVNADNSKDGGVWYGQEDILVFDTFTTLQSLLDHDEGIRLDDGLRHQGDRGNSIDFQANQQRLDDVVEGNRGILTIVIRDCSDDGPFGEFRSMQSWYFLTTFPDLTLLIFVWYPDGLFSDPQESKEQIRLGRAEVLEAKKTQLEIAVNTTGHGFKEDLQIEVVTPEEFKYLLEDWDQPKHNSPIESEPPDSYNSSGDEDGDSEASEPKIRTEDLKAIIDQYEWMFQYQERKYIERKERMKRSLHDKDETIRSLEFELSKLQHNVTGVVRGVTEKLQQRTVELKSRYLELGDYWKERREKRASRANVQN